MFDAVHITAEQLEESVTQFRAYRDRFVAHLDDGNEMNIPSFDVPLATTRFLFEYLLNTEAPALGLGVENRENFDITFDHHFDNARQEYVRIARA